MGREQRRVAPGEQIGGAGIGREGTAGRSSGGPLGYSVVSSCKCCVRACHEGRRQTSETRWRGGTGDGNEWDKGRKRDRVEGNRDQRPAGSGCYVRSCRQLLSPVYVCIGGILSAPSSHWQINERCGLEEWGWCGLPQQKWQSQVEEASVGACPGAGRDCTGGSRGNWRRSASGPGGKWGSKVGPQSIYCGTVGQWDWDSGRSLSVQGGLARNLSEIGEVLPPRPLPSLPSRDKAAGPVSRPPSVRRVHGCLHPAANAEASHAQTHSNKRNNRTVSVKKPLLSPRVLDLLDWRCLFRRWRFVSVVSFLPRVSSCQTPNLDRQIGPGSARSWDPGAPAKTVWRLWRKKGLMAGLCRVCEYGLTIEPVLREGISQWFEAASQI